MPYWAEWVVGLAVGYVVLAVVVVAAMYLRDNRAPHDPPAGGS